ncbi:hypothetical protein [Paenibacillus cineris]|uniref:Uncharacterized protein n=1 Tax=Paenibacillus cineris TaxID=237530 RepID=A0ABQ4LNR2_9BACL|nr:hypothetical protein [Paenibacillus cineris]GIO57965.1 hypothetical protein J21TS7_62830 [Paenibacillus cineris]
MESSNKPEQLDLFGGADLASPPAPVGERLNGVYYEHATGLFVSFVLGRRHYEWPAKGCTFDKEWREKTIRERAI